MQDNGSDPLTHQSVVATWHLQALWDFSWDKRASENSQWSQLSCTSVGCVSRSPWEAVELIGKLQACGFRLFEGQLQPQLQNNCRRKLTARIEEHDTVSPPTKGGEQSRVDNGRVSRVWALWGTGLCLERRISQTRGQVGNITLPFTITIDPFWGNHLTSARLGLFLFVEKDTGVNEPACVKAFADDSPSQQEHVLYYPWVPVREGGG